jgi:hypothetical protein
VSPSFKYYEYYWYYNVYTDRRVPTTTIVQNKVWLDADTSLGDLSLRELIRLAEGGGPASDVTDDDGSESDEVLTVPVPMNASTPAAIAIYDNCMILSRISVAIRDQET